LQRCTLHVVRQPLHAARFLFHADCCDGARCTFGAPSSDRSIGSDRAALRTRSARTSCRSGGSRRSSGTVRREHLLVSTSSALVRARVCFARALLIQPSASSSTRTQLAVVALVVVRKIRAIPKKGANLPPETGTKKVRDLSNKGTNHPNEGTDLSNKGMNRLNKGTDLSNKGTSLVTRVGMQTRLRATKRSSSK
jgi:hypothetical protein